MDSNTEIIALYLPQFYPFKENSRWWGAGFTEWTNVAKAKPLFKGHEQPRIPADLSFYDLRLAEVREEQVRLAKKAGVTAFCYWHYWFGGGRQLLTRVFDEVLASGKPDFKFCLGWANHSWYAKTWDKSGEDRLLIEQRYTGLDDAKSHFDYLLRAFKDKRYLKIDGKPFLFIFDPKQLPTTYIDHFDLWAKQAGFDGIYLVANLRPFDNKSHYLSIGYSAVLINRIIRYTKTDIALDRHRAKVARLKEIFPSIGRLRTLLKGFRRKPEIVDYATLYPQLTTEEELSEQVIPQLVPQWDHTPRSGVHGTAWINATPENFYHHAKQVVEAVSKKRNKLIILKSWNEWGEGNYMEPDSRFGHGFIDALRRAIDESNED